MSFKSLFLILCLTLFLVGCGNGAAVTTAPPPTDPAPVSSPQEASATEALPSPTAPSPTPRPEGWTEIMTDPVNSPLPRSDHDMAMSSDGRMLIFGGQDKDGNALGDTWLLSLDEQAHRFPQKVRALVRIRLRPLFDWNPVTPWNSPSPRYGHSAINVEGKIIVFGGTDGHQDLKDLYKFTDDWEQIQASSGSSGSEPSPRSFHHAWTYDDKLYILGGMGKNAAGKDTWLEDLWRYDTSANAWEQLPNPPGFISPSAFPAVDGSKVDFLDPHVQAFSGGPTYSYDMASGAWEQSQPQGDWPPGERSNMMWAQAGNSVYMMGGAFWNESSQTFEKTAEVWAFSLLDSKWRQLQDMPYPVSGGAAVHDPASDQIIAVLSGQSTRPSTQVFSLFAPSPNTP